MSGLNKLNFSKVSDTDNANLSVSFRIRKIVFIQHHQEIQIIYSGQTFLGITHNYQECQAVIFF